MLSECVSLITIPWVLILRPGSIVQRADDQSSNINKMCCAIHRVNSHLVTRKSMLVQICWRGDSGQCYLSFEQPGKRVSKELLLDLVSTMKVSLRIPWFSSLFYKTKPLNLIAHRVSGQRVTPCICQERIIITKLQQQILFAHTVKCWTAVWEVKGSKCSNTQGLKMVKHSSLLR